MQKNPADEGREQWVLNFYQGKHEGSEWPDAIRVRLIEQPRCSNEFRQALQRASLSATPAVLVEPAAQVRLEFGPDVRQRVSTQIRDGGRLR